MSLALEEREERFREGNVVRPVDDGTWTSVLYGTEGETLAICDSRWPGPGRRRSVCELR